MGLQCLDRSPVPRQQNCGDAELRTVKGLSVDLRPDHAQLLEHELAGVDCRRLREEALYDDEAPDARCRDRGLDRAGATTDGLDDYVWFIVPGEREGFGFGNCLDSEA